MVSLYKVVNNGNNEMQTMRVFNIPITPSEFDDYQNNVLPIIVAKQAPYNILLQAVTDLQTMKIKWDKLVGICNTDSTKGVGATANRNKYQPTYSDAIHILIFLYLLNNNDVEAADLVSFHISTASTNRKRTPPPASTVVGKVWYMEPFAQYFSFINTVTRKKAKPRSVAFVELRYMIGMEPPASVTDCTMSDFINRANKKVLFTSAHDGKKAYYYARYVNKNGSCGPWCAMFSAGII